MRNSSGRETKTKTSPANSLLQILTSPANPPSNAAGDGRRRRGRRTSPRLPQLLEGRRVRGPHCADQGVPRSLTSPPRTLRPPLASPPLADGAMFRGCRCAGDGGLRPRARAPQVPPHQRHLPQVGFRRLVMPADGSILLLLPC